MLTLMVCPVNSALSITKIWLSYHPLTPAVSENLFSAMCWHKLPSHKKFIGLCFASVRKNTPLLMLFLTPSQIHTPNIQMNTSIHNNVFHAVFSYFYGQVVTGRWLWNKQVQNDWQFPKMLKYAHFSPMLPK